MIETSYRKQQWPIVADDSLSGHLRSGLLRIVMFAIIWWILTDGAMDSWLVGVPVVLVASLVSGMLLPPCHWSLKGIAHFVPFFLWHSLRGGLDVTMRAFHPRMPIFPQILEYPMQLPPGLPRVFMVNTVSLLPGTLSTELSGDCLRVHVLDVNRPVLSELKLIEQTVAGVFVIKCRLGNKEAGCNEKI